MIRPSLRLVTRLVRETHYAWCPPEAGPERATLIHHEDDGDWRIEPVCYAEEKGDVWSSHSEEICDTNTKLDAVAVARRLLAGLPR